MNRPTPLLSFGVDISMMLMKGALLISSRAGGVENHLDTGISCICVAT